NTLVTLSLKIESENGDFLDDSEKLTYLHGGYGQIFQKLEESLASKQVGETFSLTLKPIDAFGEYDESLVVRESLKNLPQGIEVGMDLEGEDEENVWIIEKIEDGYATLNANHELAGITLVLSGEILELQHLSNEAVQEVLNMEHEH
ncbi:MAG: peptidylprolyl isomerase, partial [Campylobacterota bacterium]|nr:peptidylprolyl isomerase [Campylobacterota bacterium]